MDTDQSVAFAKKYTEDLLSFFGLNLEVSATLVDEMIEISVPINDISSLLIGRNAETLRSFQYLIATTLRNHDATISRVNLDIADYKKQRAEKIAEKARTWIEEVRSTSDSKVLDLNAADRRIVHQIATEYSDIKTFSEGEGRDRRLIIAQASS